MCVQALRDPEPINSASTLHTVNENAGKFPKRWGADIVLGVFVTVTTKAQPSRVIDPGRRCLMIPRDFLKCCWF